MSDRIVVDVEGMREVAAAIDTKRQEIFNTYVSDVGSVLNLSRECFKVSGLDYDSVKSSFDNVFNSLDERLSSLSGALTNRIIPKYENSSRSISTMFNQTFADQMRSTMSIMNER